MDFLLKLDPRNGAPLHAQLETELRRAVREGRLRPGTPLPSSRELAAELDVSRGVVVEAYAQLGAEGYLITRRGSGTSVAPAARTVVASAPEPAPTARMRYDFHPGHPDLASFPRAAWGRSVRRALREAPDALLGYPDPRGVATLRGALATFLGRSRGTVAEPDRLLVSSGLVQGLGLACRCLRERGVRRIALEDPGFLVHRLVVARSGLTAVAVPVDHDGLDVDALEASQAQAAVVTPAHQSPTGVVLSPQRRAALVDWAQRRDAYVIEDDYDAEYRYDREPVGALQGLAPERVVYAGSASKVLAPGLRLGWLLLPAALAGPVRAEKALDDLGCAVLEQLALADFLERGELDRHLRRMRPRYRARRDALVAALSRHIPGAQPLGVSAGLHLLTTLPPDVDEPALVGRAFERGIGVHGMALYRFDGASNPPALVLGYANLPEPSIERGIEELAALLAEGGAQSQ